MEASSIAGRATALHLAGGYLCFSDNQEWLCALSSASVESFRVVAAIKSNVDSARESHWHEIEPAVMGSNRLPRFRQEESAEGDAQ